MAAPKITNEQVYAFIKKNPIGVSCGIICIALAVFYYFRMDEVPAATAELEAANAEASRLSLNIKNAAQLRENLDLMVDASKKIDARVLRVSSLATNQQQFYKIEAETGTKLVDLRQNVLPSAEKGKKPSIFLTVPFTVVVQGDFPRIVSFLQHLENGPFFCRVITASLSSSTAGGASAPASSPASPGEDVPGASLTLTLNLEIVGLP
jgi:hypothetical protein